MQRRLRQVCTAVKEHSVVNYAKIATIGGFSNVDNLIVRATHPNDMPLQEKHVHQLLKLFSISGHSSIRAFSLSFTRRFGRTHCWRVALKCLILLHRLLRSVPHNSPFRSELLWIRTNGLISLYPCRFSDDSSISSPDYYTLFVRSYAHLIDEALNCSDFELEEDKKQSFIDKEEEEEMGLAEKMKEMGRKLEILPQLQSLMDRVMECRPNGSAARSFVVKSAMKYIIRDSFFCYDTFRKEIVVVLDNMFRMPYSSCTEAFGIYKKASQQFEELGEFYERCKELGFCGYYEYPLIERIPFLQIQALESFLNGMWQFTDDSSSYGSSPLPETEVVSSEKDENENESGKGGDVKRIIVDDFEPLIKFDDDDDVVVDDGHVCWEKLLEESVVLSSNNANQNLLLLDDNNNNNNNYMMMMMNNNIQVYNPRRGNPFDQQHLIMQDQQWGFNFSSSFNNFSSTSK